LSENLGKHWVDASFCPLPTTPSKTPSKELAARGKIRWPVEKSLRLAKQAGHSGRLSPEDFLKKMMAEDKKFHWTLKETVFLLPSSKITDKELSPEMLAL
jgi:hypothetical protein